jgi:NTE family protein
VILALRAAAVLTFWIGVMLTRPSLATEPTAPGPPAFRPKVGLVLSGGGARGISHIGVLKVLEEMRIRVDYIAATSMGAIVGGFFAAGMSPDEMERQITQVDWPTLFSDSPPRQDLGLRRKEYESRFPFGFELGLRDSEVRVFKGALSGSNLELFLHELTRQTDNLPSFDRLRIPFRAVATDMVTGKEVVFDRGLLYKAMRASMSVPGMFAPIEIDSHILGDGGLTNNLPVDVVKAMGADVVIAVNIGTPLMTRDQLSSVFGLAAQMLNILTEQNVRDRLQLLKPGDILIQPDLGELSFADFVKGAEFVKRGEAAARAMRSQLAALSLTPQAYTAYRAGRSYFPEGKPPAIDFVRFEHAGYSNPEVLAKAMDTKPGEPLDVEKLHKDISRLYGRGDFERIDYRLIEESSRRGLVLDVDEKSWGPNYFRFGITLDTDLKGESRFNLIAGHRRTWLNSLGAEWVNELTIGHTRRIASELYQPLNTGNWLFVAPYGEIKREPEDIFLAAHRVAEYDLLSEQAGVDLGTPFGSYGELRAGYRRAHYRADPLIALPGFPTGFSDTGGINLLARYDRLDDPFFPTQGAKATLQYFIGSKELGGDGSSKHAELTAQLPIALGVKDTLGAAVRVGASSGGLELATDFTLGGFLQLSGLRTDQLRGNYVGFGRVVYLHELGRSTAIGRGLYLGASLELGNTWGARSDVSVMGLVGAGSVFFAADTYLGPFYVAYGRASNGNSSFYLFLGRPQ